MKQWCIRQWACCWLICCAASTLGAQNLVFNPDFDLFLNCPPYLGQIHEAAGWDSPNFATTDFFHRCSDSVNGNGVPANRLGWQQPLSGSGYAGIRLWIPPGIATPDQREYLVSRLTAPLQADSLYEVRFFASLADFSTHTTDALGLGLSDSAFNDDRLQAFIPVARHPAGDWLDDPEGWTLIRAQYRAHGGEQYLIIGNFLSDAALSLLALPLPAPDPVLAVYVYVDAVSITLVTADSTATDPGLPPCAGSNESLERDSLLCRGAAWEVRVPPGTEEYRWSDGYPGAVRLLEAPGDYQLTLRSGCDTLVQSLRVWVQDCDCEWIPQNVFSPNGDGLNDVFQLELAPGIADAAWMVADRWGREVFRHTGPGGFWDGRTRGIPAPPGVYYWRLNYTCQAGGVPVRRSAGGHVLLVR